jgi:hypothetical protein
VVRGRMSSADADAPLGPGARRFTEAVQAGVAACLAQQPDPDRYLSVTLSSEPTHWVGALRWTPDPGDDAGVAAVQTALARVAGEVDCVRDGDDARCELRCPRD